MKQEITLKIRVDSDNDEFMNFIEWKGFDKRTPINNSIKLVGLLETIKQEELQKILEAEVKE